jgi:type I restriction enzyme, S subunit
MSICATIGEPIIAAMEACIHDGFVIFDEHESFVTPNFLVQFLRLRQSYFRSQGQTGTQANLNTSIVKSCLIGIPPLSEQDRIVAALDAHDVRIRAEEAYRDKLKLLKKGLMDDLLTGRVRVAAAMEMVS